MGLARTFVGFSSTDLDQYNLMCAWKAHEKIDFDFCDCQLRKAIRSDDEDYVKSLCRDRLNTAGTFIQLIGQDTRSKHKYVRWEADVAIEKGCRLICVNLDKWRFANQDTCPPILRTAGALFVPFSPKVVAHAIENWQPPTPRTHDWHYYGDADYTAWGYVLNGNTAVMPPKPPPFVVTPRW